MSKDEGPTLQGFIDFLPIFIPFILVMLVFIFGITFGQYSGGNSCVGLPYMAVLLSSPLWGLWLFLKLDDRQTKQKPSQETGPHNGSVSDAETKEEK